MRRFQQILRFAQDDRCHRVTAHIRMTGAAPPFFSFRAALSS
jgi:hypothetical protein